VSPKEASCIIGPGGARVGEIQHQTGAKLTLSGRNTYYPGTQLQEVNIQGVNMECVLTAAISCLGNILKDTGAVAGGDVNIEPGGARLKVVIPSQCVLALIGPGGERLQSLQGATGISVYIDSTQIPPDGSGIAEQVVALNGPLAGLHTAVPIVAECIAQHIGEPWFASWATSSNCGAIFPGLLLFQDVQNGKVLQDVQNQAAWELGAMVGS